MGVFTKWIICLTCLIALQACKHPLVIVGEGDIVDANNTGHGCTLEQFQAQDAACTENEVSGDYVVNYKAEPRPGWRFVRWEGPCSLRSAFQHCRLDMSEDGVTWWEENLPDAELPPSTAVFEPITGKTGFLLAGTAVAGVAYETPTLQGVTGLDGSFQYEEGETLRFTIGATLLGEAPGSEHITPFDLAGSPVLTGLDIPWALPNEEDPFQTVINLAVLLHSLDHDADLTNGIEIRPGVADLLMRVKLAVRQRPDTFPHASDPEGETVYLAQDWETFQRDPTFHHIVGLANRKHRFSSPHQIVKPELAMANLYRSLGLDPRIVGLSLLESGGMAIDRFAYDASGYLTRHETSDFGGGYEIWQYDLYGNVTRHEEHGTLYDHHPVETWQYDDKGDMIQYERGGSNQFDYAIGRTESGTYDVDGNQTLWTTVITSEGGTEREVESSGYVYDRFERLAQYIEDSDTLYNDGSRFHSVEIFEYLYYAEGELSNFTLSRDVPLADGVPDSSRSVEINKSGSVTRYESTFSFGGRLVKKWQYNSDGDVTRYKSGERVWLFLYEYDTDGNVTRRERVNTSSDAVEEVVTWEYGHAGSAVLKEVQRPSIPPEAENEYHSLESWQYHTNGVVKLYTFEAKFRVTDLGSSWDVHDNRIYQYDTSGNLTRYEEPGFEVRSWQYNAAGHLTREEIDSDEQGRNVRTWLYDSDGNLVQDGKGTYQYEGTGWGFIFSPRVSPFSVSLVPPEPQPNVDYRNFWGMGTAP
jgi:YD repeat-containing protein